MGADCTATFSPFIVPPTYRLRFGPGGPIINPGMVCWRSDVVLEGKVLVGLEHHTGDGTKLAYHACAGPITESVMAAPPAGLQSSTGGGTGGTGSGQTGLGGPGSIGPGYPPGTGVHTPPRGGGGPPPPPIIELSGCIGLAEPYLEIGDGIFGPEGLGYQKYRTPFTPTPPPLSTCGYSPTGPFCPVHATVPNEFLVRATLHTWDPMLILGCSATFGQSTITSFQTVCWHPGPGLPPCPNMQPAAVAGCFCEWSCGIPVQGPIHCINTSGAAIVSVYLRLFTKPITSWGGCWPLMPPGCNFGGAAAWIPLPVNVGDVELQIFWTKNTTFEGVQTVGTRAIYRNLFDFNSCNISDFPLGHWTVLSSPHGTVSGVQGWQIEDPPGGGGDLVCVYPGNLGVEFDLEFTPFDIPPLTEPAGQPPAILRRASQLARAVTGPRLTENEVGQRLGICAGCPANKDNYCTDCGCGRWPLARLDRKARMAYATCPRGLWPLVQSLNPK